MAAAMAHGAFGNGGLPKDVRSQIGAYRSLRMSPDEKLRFAGALLSRRVILEGVLMSLEGEVREGAVLSAHRLCETPNARAAMTLSIGGRAASRDQVRDARTRVTKEIATLDGLVEQATDDSQDLSRSDQSAKASPRVVHLQNRLNSLGHRVSADGIFGPVTEESVKDFQARVGLEDTGVVDEMTRAALRNGGRISMPGTPPGVAPGTPAPALAPIGDGDPNKETGNAAAQTAQSGSQPAETNTDESEPKKDSKAKKKQITVCVDMARVLDPRGSNEQLQELFSAAAREAASSPEARAAAAATRKAHMGGGGDGVQDHLDALAGASHSDLVQQVSGPHLHAAAQVMALRGMSDQAKVLSGAAVSRDRIEKGMASPGTQASTGALDDHARSVAGWHYMAAMGKFIGGQMARHMGGDFSAVARNPAEPFEAAMQAMRAERTVRAPVPMRGSLRGLDDPARHPILAPGGRLARIHAARTDDEDGRSAMRLCECGAPVRGSGVCQRGHRALVEELGPPTDKHVKLMDELQKHMDAHADKDGLFKDPAHDQKAWELMRQIGHEAAKRENAPAEVKQAAALDEPPESTEEAAMVCECGAPVRESGVCQRGHRLEERWEMPTHEAHLGALDHAERGKHIAKAMHHAEGLASPGASKGRRHYKLPEHEAHLGALDHVKRAADAHAAGRHDDATRALHQAIGATKDKTLIGHLKRALGHKRVGQKMTQPKHHSPMSKSEGAKAMHAHVMSMQMARVDEVLVQEAIGPIKKGAFHAWLGKDPEESITDADIARGIAAGGHPAKMARFAKAARGFNHRRAQEADSRGDFPEGQMPSACPKCGARVRKGVCQRGHRVGA